MSKIVLYKSLFDCYPTLGDEYKKISKKLPCISIKSLEGFIYEFTNKDKFVSKALQVLDATKEQLFIKEMNIYLCVMENSGGTDKIQDYYKIWKYLKKQGYGIDNFNMGYEYKTMLNNSVVYCGNAKFEFRDMDKALNILYDNQNYSFIYITSDKTLTIDNKVKELYDMLLNENIKKIAYEAFDFSSLYDNMHFNDSIIKILSDGEELCMDIIQRCKSEEE